MRAELAAIAERAIEAITDDKALDQLCADLRTMFGASNHVMHVVSAGLIDGQILNTTYSESILRDYAAYYGPLDLWAVEADRLNQSIVCLGEEIVPVPTLLKSEFYNDFARHIGSANLLSMAYPVEQSGFVALSLHRTSEQGPFRLEDREQFNRLAPVIRGMLRAKAMLQNGTTRERLGMDALQAIGRIVLVVDRGARVRFANSAAEVMRSSESRFGPGGDMIEAWLGLGTAARLGGPRLRAAIVGVIDGYSTADEMVLARPHPRPALSVEVIRMPRSAGIATPALALLVVTPLQSRKTPKIERLIEIMGLSPAEAQLVAALAAGVSIADYAKQRHLSIETVRSQLKSAFAKSGTNRQAELVAAALSLAG